jgi:hypothetical protein
MVDVSIATGAEQPVNRYAAASSTTFEEGDFVALEDVDGDGEAELVHADVTNGRPAVGVAIGSVADPDALDDQIDNLARDLVKTQQTTVGQRLAYVRYGTEIEDTDAADDIYQGDYGEPVYLVQGKSGTDKKYVKDSEVGSVLAAGDVKQVVGYAKESRKIALEVDATYTTV